MQVDVENRVNSCIRRVSAALNVSAFIKMKKVNTIQIALCVVHENRRSHIKHGISQIEMNVLISYSVPNPFLSFVHSLFVYFFYCVRLRAVLVN